MYKVIRFCWLPVSGYSYESVGTRWAAEVNERVGFLSKDTVLPEITFKACLRIEVSSERGSQLILKLSKPKNHIPPKKEEKTGQGCIIFGGQV